MSKLLGFLVFAISLAFAKDYEKIWESSIEVISANQISHAAGTTELTGDVIIKTGDVILSANTVEYDQKKNFINANGDVTILYRGNVYKSDSAKFSSDMTNGLAKNIDIWLKDNYRIATKEINVDTKSKTVAQYCTMSTCHRSHGKNHDLLWKIKAQQVVYDKEKEEINYKNAYLEFYGLPIFFLPYFSHPSPIVKKKSGFLFPKILYSRNLGLIIIPKYYYAVADNAEIFIKPVISGKNSILWADLNAIFMEGELQLSGSFQSKVTKHHARFNVDEEEEYRGIKRRGYRGHLKGHFKKYIADDANLFFNLYTVTDKSYLDVYSFIDHVNSGLSLLDNLAESNFGIENVNENSYHIVKFITYQNTRLKYSLYKTPNILPYFESNLYKNYKILKINTLFYSDFISINVDYKNDKKDSKIYWSGGCSMTKKLPGGHILLLDVNLIANMYNLRKYTKATTSGESNKNLSRIYPNSTISYTLPLLTVYNRNIKGVLTPRVDLFFASKFKEKYQDYIEYSDMVFNYLETNNSNIFNESLTSRINQINTGNKVSYGLEHAFYQYGQNVANYYISHSYQFEKKRYDVPSETGYKYRSSALLVGGDFRVYNFDLGTDLVLKHNIKGILRSKSYAKFESDKSAVSVGVFCGKQYSNDVDSKHFRSFFSDVSYKLNSRVSLMSNVLIGEKCKILIAEFGMLYEDECFSSSLGIERINYRKVDAKPDIRIHFTFHIKGIN